MPVLFRSAQVTLARMDSGLILDDEVERLVFSSLAPLLPEEVCYVLDRTIACEVRPCQPTFPFVYFTS